MGVNTENRTRIAARLAAPLLFLLSFVALLGGALLAPFAGGLPGIAVAVGGFCGYVVLFSRALRRLAIDWDSWREPGPRWRPEKPRKPAKDGNGTGLRVVAAMIISAAAALSLLPPVATF